MSGQPAVVEKGRYADLRLRRMVYLSRYAVGGWRHTRERRQGSVGFWTGSVEGFACERSSHIPTAEFRMSTRA